MEMMVLLGGMMTMLTVSLAFQYAMTRKKALRVKIKD